MCGMPEVKADEGDYVKRKAAGLPFLEPAVSPGVTAGRRASLPRNGASYSPGPEALFSNRECQK